MKIKLLIILSILIYSSRTQGQILQPVKWSYAAKITRNGEAILFFKATIDPGWHIYSQKVIDGGPVKTSFEFISAKSYKLIGKTVEPKPITRMEKVFGMDVSFFENSVVFQQRVKIKGKSATITGRLNYMTCNDQKCLPPEEVAFEIPVK